MNIKMILTNGFKPDSRVLREASFLIEIGYEVTIYAWDRDSSYKLKKIENYEGINIKRYSTSSEYGTGLKQLFAYLKFTYYLRKSLNLSNQNIIYAHDFDGLLAFHISTIYKRKKNKPKLIYDSHEFELGRAGKSGRVRKWFIYHLEKYLIKRSDLVIMVNDSIAERVQSIYHLKTKPLVIRNVPEYWHLDEGVIETKRSELLRLFKNKSIDFIVMHHGLISKYRGIGNVLEALTQQENIGMVVLGDGPEKDLQVLKVKTHELNITDRVAFHPAVDIDELWQYVGASDVGIMTIPAISESYYYGLPNKLFENIQGLTPVIGTHYPEMKKIIEGYNIGLSVDPNNVLAISEAIKTMREDKEMYAEFKKNLLKAKEELHWGNEKKKFENEIDNINTMLTKRKK